VLSVGLLRAAVLALGLAVASTVSFALDGSALTVTLAAATAVAVGVALVFALAAVSAARSAAATARAIGGGDYAARVSGVRGDPAALGESINAMAKAVQETLETASIAQSRLMAALNSSIDATVAVDAAGRITFANDAARRLLSPHGQQLTGSPFAYFLPDDRLVDALRATSEERRSLSVYIERPGKQYLQVVTTPILSGGDWASLAVFHDLSEVRRAEEVRRDFIANVSHELRTPLAALKSVIETLEAGAKDDPASAADFLARADSEVDRLVQMVEELLELSRLESGDIPLARKPLDFGFLRNAVERLHRQAERAGVTLSLEAGEDLPPAVGDAEMLERVVINLVHNAIKFTPAGGTVSVRARAVEGAVQVSVTDTGVGILSEDLPRIFERFFKADRSRGGGGTGLGLAVARHAVEAHGGVVTVQSTPGEGSTFTFTIPAVAS
jgi:two-component system phosphate regulon sensor histidine kinase PhoR